MPKLRNLSGADVLQSVRDFGVIAAGKPHQSSTFQRRESTDSVNVSAALMLFPAMTSNLIKIAIGMGTEDVPAHLGGFRRCSDLRLSLARVRMVQLFRLGPGKRGGRLILD